MIDRAGHNLMPLVSCLIYTLNEEVNLPHCLAALDWCDDIVVVDSFSNDRTEEIARRAGARFVQHPFTGFGDQRNWSLENIPLKNPWALILDADERPTSELISELAARLPSTPDDVSAFRVRRRFHLWGKWLKYSSLYPSWVVRLVRVGSVRYVNRGHAETQDVSGRVESLGHDLIDENHKPIEDWWNRQVRYATEEALHEMSAPRFKPLDLGSLDPLLRRTAMKGLARKLPGRGIWYFIYSYLLRGGFLDGIDGLRFCSMKSIYMQMIAIKKRELRANQFADSRTGPSAPQDPLRCLPVAANLRQRDGKPIDQAPSCTPPAHDFITS